MQHNADHKQWEQKYRPTSFAAVRGQETAVRALSGMSIKRSCKYPLLLCGAVGSGKTTLVRLYAQALNCDYVRSDGSPCHSCQSCRAPYSTYLNEYNAPLLSAEPGRMRWVLQEDVRAPRGDDVKVNVFFFDEAQGVSGADQDLMLKLLEDLPERVAVCFATTERHKLSPALRSRLYNIDIRPIRPEVAIEILKSVADAEGVQYELPAFHLMVAALPPQARDLVKSLQELHGQGPRIDVPLVKAGCGISVYDKLAAYVLALAAQDRVAQTRAIVDWGDSYANKMSWIVRFLTTVYYNDILGQRIVIDSLCYSMDIIRWQFVGRLCEQFGGCQPVQLAEAVDKWLMFWSQPSPAGEEALALRFALFETLVNRAAPARTALASVPRTSAASIDEPIASTSCPVWESLNTPAESRFIEREDVREIVHRASYLMQEHGVTFNVSFRIEPLVCGDKSDGAYFESILNACFQLSIGLPDKGERFAAALLVERSGSAIIGRLAAWIPDLLAGSQTFDWLLRWEEDTRRGGVDIQGGSTVSLRDHQFHWQAVRELCAGYDADEESAPRGQNLRHLLKIPPAVRRQPGPFAAPRLAFGGRLRSAAMQTGCANGMAPVSAFDARVWEEVTSGWELKEHPDRTAEAKRRSRAIAQLEARHQDNAVACDSAIAELRQDWAALPDGSFPRTWRKEW